MKVIPASFTPCDLIFNQVSKPVDYMMCKSINVYDDRWRVNIYSKRLVDDIEGTHISQSYFTIFNDETNVLNIIS